MWNSSQPLVVLAFNALLSEIPVPSGICTCWDCKPGKAKEGKPRRQLWARCNAALTAKWNCISVHFMLPFYCSNIKFHPLLEHETLKSFPCDIDLAAPRMDQGQKYLPRCNREYLLTFFFKKIFTLYPAWSIARGKEELHFTWYRPLILPRGFLQWVRRDASPPRPTSILTGW